MKDDKPESTRVVDRRPKGLQLARHGSVQFGFDYGFEGPREERRFVSKPLLMRER